MCLSYYIYVYCLVRGSKKDRYKSSKIVLGRFIPQNMTWRGWAQRLLTEPSPNTMSYIAVGEVCF